MSSDESSRSDSDSYRSDQSDDEDDDDDKTEEEEEEDMAADDLPDEDVIYEQSFAIENENIDIEELYKRIPKGQRIDNNSKLPSVSEDHLELIDELRKDGIIQSDQVYKLMRSVDFNWFYKTYPPEWPQTNARMLENALTVVRPGADILSFPLNMYFNVCMTLHVGHEGSVLCFGHSVNINMLKLSGLSWLEADDRLRFTYETLKASFGSCYSEFLEEGFPLRMPYDAVLLATLQRANDKGEPELSMAVAKQIKPGGICYQPSSGISVPVVLPNEDEDQPQPNQSEQFGPSLPQSESCQLEPAPELQQPALASDKDIKFEPMSTEEPEQHPLPPLAPQTIPQPPLTDFHQQPLPSDYSW